MRLRIRTKVSGSIQPKASKSSRRLYCSRPLLCQLPPGWARSQAGRPEEQSGSTATFQNQQAVGNALTQALPCCLTSVLGWPSRARPLSSRARGRCASTACCPRVLCRGDFNRGDTAALFLEGSQAEPFFKVQSEICICGLAQKHPTT